MKRFLIALSVLAALTMPASALNCSTGAGELGKAPCVFTVDNRTIIKGLCEVSESGDGRGIDIFLGRQHAALGWNGNGAPGPHNGWWEVQFTKPRFVRKDIELGGVRLRKGDKIMPMFAAANFDPQANPGKA